MRPRRVRGGWLAVAIVIVLVAILRPFLGRTFDYFFEDI
jgi:hypothetical protein